MLTFELVLKSSAVVADILDNVIPLNATGLFVAEITEPDVIVTLVISLLAIANPAVIAIGSLEYALVVLLHSSTVNRFLLPESIFCIFILLASNFPPEMVATAS